MTENRLVDLSNEEYRAARKALYMGEQPAPEPFAPGWLQRQIERSIAILDALPEGLRRSLSHGEPRQSPQPVMPARNEATR